MHYTVGAYNTLRFKVPKSDVAINNEKSAQRDANTARALAVVRFGHRPPAVTNPPTTHRQDRLQYTAPLASAQCRLGLGVF